MPLNDFLAIEGNPILESKDGSLQESVSLIDKESKLIKTSSVIDVKNIIANSKDMLRILYFYDSGNFYISSEPYNFIHSDLVRIIYKNGEEESIEMKQPEEIGYSTEYYPDALSIISIPKENNFVTQDASGVEYNVITQDYYDLGYEYENHYIMFRDEDGEDYKSCPLFKGVEIIDYSMELEGGPMVESLLLEELPKELARKIYGKQYIDVGDFVTNSLPKKVNIYNILKDGVQIDIHKASFKKVEKEDFLKLIQTDSVPVGSIIYGEYKGTSIILIRAVSWWRVTISIDSSKIQRYTKRSIEEYLKSLNIDKSELVHDIYSPYNLDDAVLNKLDNVSIFICSSSPAYERNFKFKSANERKSLQKEFNSILLDNNIDLDKIHESIDNVFDIKYLSDIAYRYVPYALKDRYAD